MSDEIKKIGEEVSNEAKESFTAVKEEAAEVFQEAKAAIKGETLDTANNVGGAGYRAAEDPSKKSPATASLVLGILSLICALFGYGAILGLILGIIGVVLGAKARKINQTGVATAGFVCSLIGLVICGVAIVCVVACAGTIGILSLGQ